MYSQPVTDESFADEVLASDIPVLVDFWSPGCRPCVAMSAVVAEVAREVEGRAKVVLANVMEAGDSALQHGVGRVPCFLVFRGGKLITQLSGIRSREELIDALGPLPE